MAGITGVVTIIMAGMVDTTDIVAASVLAQRLPWDSARLLSAPRWVQQQPKRPQRRRAITPTVIGMCGIPGSASGSANRANGINAVLSKHFLKPIGAPPL
ncbi:hypothetical protein C4568_04915 [Candidatus Parcubacteria bacterium]|nr:MAG: hypothetical protein C4568_04915 [Candidatus Parcubacteria bacterium]